jgi:hypothetical protein
MFGGEGGTFVDEHLQRLGGEEFEPGGAVGAVVDGEHVFAEPLKLHAVKPAAVSLAERLNGGLLGMLGRDASDGVARSDRDAGEQIGWHCHAGRDLDIDQPRVDQPPPYAGVILGPGELEGIAALVAVLPAGARVTLERD